MSDESKVCNQCCGTIGFEEPCWFVGDGWICAGCARELDSERSVVPVTAVDLKEIVLPVLQVYLGPIKYWSAQPMAPEWALTDFDRSILQRLEQVITDLKAKCP